MGNSKTLWSDPDRRRHFIIPDDEVLPTGEFELRTPLGRQLIIAEGAADAYEVSQQEAVAWLSSQFSIVVNEAKDAILETMREKMTSEPDVDAWFDERRRRRRARSSATPKRDKDERPSSAREKENQAKPDVFVAILEELKKEFLKTAASADKSTHTGFDGLPDLISRLRESLLAQGDPEQTAQGLESLARRIQETAEAISSKLNNLANEVRASARDEGPEDQR